MKRIISLVLCAAVMFSVLAASGCSKNKKTVYSDNSAMFFENANTSGKIINSILKDMKLDFGTDSLPEFDSLVTDAELNFNEITWNGEDLTDGNAVSAVVNGANNFADGTASLDTQLSVGDDRADLSYVADKYTRFAGLNGTLAKIAPKSAERISERLKDIDVLSLLGELSGVYDAINRKLAEMTSNDDFEVSTETFTANGHEFSAAKKLTLSFDADDICAIFDYAAEQVDPKGEAVKLIAGIDREEIKKSECTLSDTRYFDDNGEFVRESLTLTHPTSVTVYKDSTAHSDSETTSAASDSTSASSSATSASAAAEGNSDTATTTASPEGQVEQTTEVYVFNLYHFEDETQFVWLASGEYTFFNDYNSRVAAFLVKNKEIADTENGEDEDSSADGKAGFSVSVTDFDSNTWESAINGDIYIGEKDSKPVITYDAAVNIQVGSSSIFGLPFGFTATVNDFDSDGFDLKGHFVFNAFGLYVADFDFTLEGRFDEKTDAVTLPSDGAVLNAEFREERLESISDSAPAVAKLLGKYNDYYNTNGFLRINKLDVLLENTSQNQYIYLFRDLTGHIDEPFKYEFTDDKMISTDIADSSKTVEYDFKKGETEDTIILGGNTYTKKDAPDVKGDVYTLGNNEELKLYLYDNGVGVFSYEIAYNFVPETGEILFFYLLSHEYSAASMLMNNRVAYLNAEPFTVKSYGFDRAEGDNSGVAGEE